VSVPDTSWLEKLSENQRMVADLVGVDNFKKLMDTYGGTYVYIPKAGRADRLERNEQIKSEFNGYNFRELALKYDLSEVWIRNIVSDRVKIVRAQPINGQLTLF